MKQRIGSTSSGSGTIATLRIYLKGLARFVRILIFEKLTVVHAVLWLGFWAAAAWVVSVLSIVVSMGVLGVGALLYTPSRRALLEQKHRLIRRGDRIEYVKADAEEGMPEFGSGIVLRRISREHVATAGGFDPETLDLYVHFLLLDTGNENRIVPFEWVTAMEMDEAL